MTQIANRPDRRGVVSVLWLLTGLWLMACAPTVTATPAILTLALATAAPLAPTLSPMPSATVTATVSATPVPPTATIPPTRTSSPTAITIVTVAATAMPRPTATIDPLLRIGQTQTRGGALMVVVPAGEFVMGSQNDPFAFAHETPQRRVYLDAFWIDEFEVTNALYAQCVSARVCRPPAQVRSSTRAAYYGQPEFADHPIIYVSWSDAKTFCAWSGKRLPSEAEWEKAARGPGGSLYPWGDGFEADRVNAAPNGPGDTTRVGSYPSGASVYGAHDMAGNVWEWVADFYQSDYYRVALTINPMGPGSGPPPAEATARPASDGIGVLRGGAWNNNLRAVRSANRLNYFQRHVGFEAGFRCAWGGGK